MDDLFYFSPEDYFDQFIESKRRKQRTLLSSFLGFLISNRMIPSWVLNQTFNFHNFENQEKIVFYSKIYNKLEHKILTDSNIKLAGILSQKRDLELDTQIKLLNIHPTISVNLAKKKCSSKKVLNELMKNPEFCIKKALLQNPNLPLNILRDLECEFPKEVKNHPNWKSSAFLILDFLEKKSKN